jgi:hypothetical protein
MSSVQVLPNGTVQFTILSSHASTGNVTGPQ